MTHPPGQPGGGSGSSGGGTTGPGRLSDRAFAHLDAVFDSVIGRLGTAIYRGDRVAQADANSSVADIRAAVHLAAGKSPADLDRNGWLR